MPLEFRFPDVGEGVVEGEIRRWLVREGDHVKADQPLVEVETDKALVELPAPRAGTILKIAAGQGETVRVGQVIVVIGDAGESLPAGEQARRQSSTIVGDLEGTPHELTLDRAETPRAPAAKGKVRAIPAVRKLAQELGVNLDEVRGSGPDGRVLHEDVVRAAQRGSQAGTTAPTVADDAEIERVPMPRLRRTIALAMVQSKFTA
ncbi:MAG TPA: biotin/lipoyl-containing protein, partial [Methylomirabilota bacterium]|nr:biotin/lipoyl-containing protein [Methylomirabilota bacterium]